LRDQLDMSVLELFSVEAFDVYFDQFFELIEPLHRIIHLIALVIKEKGKFRKSDCQYFIDKGVAIVFDTKRQVKFNIEK
jgi:hypothetical protein